MTHSALSKSSSPQKLKLLSAAESSTGVTTRGFVGGARKSSDPNSHASSQLLVDTGITEKNMETTLVWGLYRGIL